MNLALAQPWCSIGSDGSALADRGPAPPRASRTRAASARSRACSASTSASGTCSRLEDAVRKMTSLNAAKLGLLDRGLLRPGQFADVTVFDPETVIDQATYLEPFQYSEGIDHVIVNGQLVLDDGKPTGARPGRALRHAAGG